MATDEDLARVRATHAPPLVFGAALFSTPVAVRYRRWSGAVF
ncbi:hypothetical protein [Streptomyces sp. NPDC001250]